MKAKTLKPNRNNIETYLPIFSGFYGSRWEDPNFYGESDYFGLPDNFDFSSFFKWNEYYEALSKYFVGQVEWEMKDFIEIIQYQRLNSPKEYNFQNDSIYVIIRPKKKEIAKYIYENKAAFSKYLEDNLKSRDGFISWHSHIFEDWETNTQKFMVWDKRLDSRGFNLGFVLSFIAYNEQLEESNIFEESDSNVYVSEFLNEDFYQMIKDMEENEFINRDNLIEAKQSGNPLLNLNEQIELIKKFVRENYQKSNVKELTIETFSQIETGFYDVLEDFIHIEKVINFQIVEIESKTLKLEFA